MKYFLDTEFIEGFHKPVLGKRRHFIDLISIGIVSEDGQSFYRVSKDYNYNDADKWVQENVILPIYKQTVSGDARNRYNAESFHSYYGKSNEGIAMDILEFFGCEYQDGFWAAPVGIEVYGYYADYDWVLFCSLFGRMIDLPAGFPMYCKDLKQMMDEKGLGKEWKQKNCPDPEGEHNALVDAKWNRKLFELLNIEQGVKVSDTTMLNSSTEADKPLPNPVTNDLVKELKEIYQLTMPDIKDDDEFNNVERCCDALNKICVMVAHLIPKVKALPLQNSPVTG